MKRREFVKGTVLSGLYLSLPIPFKACSEPIQPVYFGMIADVHKDIMFDADERLKVFIDESSEKALDFIVQLGDFCIPREQNSGFMDVWNSYKGAKYHVLGNHDMDLGYSKDETRAFWKMSSNYYSFDKGGVHFIVLDGNDKNPGEWQGYYRYIGAEQKQWLIDDLKKTEKPTVIFSHQTLELASDGVANMDEIRSLLEEENTRSGFKKVLCCFSGHTHTDFAKEINGIYYVQINSASYRWVGGDYERERYSKEIHETYRNLKYTLPYKESLYTFVKIDESGIHIAPKETSFVGPGPEEMGGPITSDNDPIVPIISERQLKYKV